jgi:hypothetical protein
MKSYDLKFKQFSWEIGFGLALAVIFGYVAARHAGMYPVIFADEQLYSRFARLVPLKDATIPSYLYLSLFGLTNACGNGFLECTRYLNLLFFIAAGPFIYLSARTVCSKPAAMMVALMCMLAPFKSYTAYFMPESMYFFAFSVLTWLALARRTMHWARLALATGAVLGAMTLVKVHALFLVPALCAYLLYASWASRRDGPWFRIGLASACLAVAAVFATKFALGYAFVGGEGLHLLGSFYGNQASGSLSASDALLKLMPAALISLKGHLMMLALLFGLPLAAIVHFVLSPGARANAGADVAALKVYSILMIGVALMLAVFYTASIADWGVKEGVRLHVRYYSFTFPLLVMIGAAHAGDAWRPSWPALPWLIAAVLAAALLYSATELPATYRLLMGDGPEIFSLGLGDTRARIVLAVELAILAVWALNRKRAAALFLFVLLPLSVLNAEVAANKFRAAARTPSMYDNAGRFAHDYLAPADRNNVTIAGTNLGELMRTKFHLDSADADLMDIPSGSPLQPYQLPGRKSWLLVVGDHALPPGVTPVVKTAEFALVNTNPNNRPLGNVKFSGPLAGQLLAGAEGLAGPEPWGRWSTARRVRLHFNAPLPKQLNLFLTVQAFGPNAEQEFKVRAGQAEASFRGPGMPQEIFLQLQTDGTEKTVTIDIPQPVSPKALGWSGDTRELGLGMIRVEIGTAAR